jgi:three-Cys-motif partner protein
MDALGGAWTHQKLKAVENYLIAYQNVMLKQRWETVYIDAFCGAGSVKLRNDTIAQGSAIQALKLQRPFDHYYFIDMNKASLARLEKQVEEQHTDRIDRVHFRQGDVNEILPALVDALDNERHRAVVFADPYGMQLDWATVEAIARKTIIDFWLLVPTGMGINRLATKNPTKITDAWGKRLDRFLGETGWRERWYEPNRMPDLFTGAEANQKVATIKAIDTDFQNRLRTVFPCVAEPVLHLQHGGRNMFSLMFACSNPSRPAQAAAKRIAESILKG